MYQYQVMQTTIKALKGVRDSARTNKGPAHSLVGAAPAALNQLTVLCIIHPRCDTLPCSVPQCGTAHRAGRDWGLKSNVKSGNQCSDAAAINLLCLSSTAAFMTLPSDDSDMGEAPGRGARPAAAAC